MEELHKDIIVDIYNNTSDKDYITEARQLEETIKLLCKRLKYINYFKLGYFNDTTKLYNVVLDKDVMLDDDYNELTDYIGYGYGKNCQKRVYFTKSDIAKIWKQ